MNTLTFPSALVLPARAVHTVPSAPGLQLVCNEGSLWLTLDDDPRDIVLEAGECFTVPDERRAIVYALEPSRLTLRAAPQARAAASTSPSRCAPSFSHQHA